ncbi:uncharacterized protein C8R40DRAFT_129404 [Lentinula edodes]|uniref:uncharacterized protein n=1 Tax=Lentinula edodes TaxID=5353 RepID=UPI001E8D2392|nr:uncharacterized protein C8R40DRAFT_129404 [Lentinula edodes]KAH7876340.1 hypothetical protein C8R40DRAFT_129404 [Lentinula edodes]
MCRKARSMPELSYSSTIHRCIVQGACRQPYKLPYQTYNEKLQGTKSLLLTTNPLRGAASPFILHSIFCQQSLSLYLAEILRIPFVFLLSTPVRLFPSLR